LHQPVPANFFTYRLASNTQSLGCSYTDIGDLIEEQEEEEEEK
jgi:hypothetical protein